MRVLLLVIALVRTWANTRTIPVSFWPSCCCERHALHRALLRLRACFGVVADAMTEVDWQTETLISESSKRIFNQTLCPHSSCLPFHPTGDFGVRWAGVMSAPSRSVLREVALGNSRTCQQVPNPGVTHTHTHNTRHRQTTLITHLQSHSLRRHPTPQADCHHHWHRRQRHGLHC